MIPVQILQDNSSGSSAIADRVIIWIADTIDAISSPDYSELYSDFDKLIQVFPHFATLRHLIGSVKDFLRQLHDLSSVQNLPEAFNRFIKQYKETWQQNHTLAAEHLVRNIKFEGKTLLLHSHSSSIIRLFEVLAREGLTSGVIQTVSEPVQEGKLQAVRIAAIGFQVRLINEAAASRFMDETDMLVTGADAIFNDSIINKAGTLPLALLCRHFSKPWYVLADSRKLINCSLSEMYPNGFAEKEKPAMEIWNDPPSSVRPVNYYFETIPRGFAASIFTELAPSV